MLQSYLDLFINKISISVLLILLCRFISHKIIDYIKNGHDVLEQSHRSQISKTKNITVFFIIVLLFSIWWEELQEHGLSLAAFAVAFVIASKEIILCIAGSLLRATSHSFTVGDWIKCNQHYGEVIEHNLLTTILQEVDIQNNNYNYTGKTITLPNSHFITADIQNLNFMRRYVYHSFTLISVHREGVVQTRKFLLAKIKEITATFFEVSQRYNNLIEKKLGIDLPGEEADVRVTITSAGLIDFSITLFCPTEQALALEQKITLYFLAYIEHTKTS